MAESNPKPLEAENKSSEVINLGDAGHTMSDSSSDSELMKSQMLSHKKRKRVPKLIAEKRPLSSTDDSDKENRKKKGGVNISDDNASQSVDSSPIYQNQEGHPDFPFNDKSESDEKSDNGNSYHS